MMIQIQAGFTPSQKTKYIYIYLRLSPATSQNSNMMSQFLEPQRSENIFDHMVRELNFHIHNAPPLIRLVPGKQKFPQHWKNVRFRCSTSFPIFSSLGGHLPRPQTTGSIKNAWKETQFWGHQETKRGGGTDCPHSALQLGKRGDTESEWLFSSTMPWDVPFTFPWAWILSQPFHTAWMSP